MSRPTSFASGRANSPSSSPTKAAPASASIAAATSRWPCAIKSLLYDEGYTIPGARQVFKAELRHKEPQLALTVDNAPLSVDTRQLRKLQKDLRDLHALLSKPAARSAVHPIRTSRAHTTRHAAEKLFDLPPFPENTNR